MAQSINESASEPKERPPYDDLIEMLLNGDIIPFLGAGASAFAVDQDGGAPPSAKSLSENLAKGAGISIRYEGCEHSRMDLARIASYYQHCVAPRPRLDEVITKALVNPRYKPNPLHRFLARAALKKPMLIITTNYDNLLEQAFKEAGAPFEVVATPVNDLVYVGAAGPTGNEADDQVGTDMAGGVLHWVGGKADWELEWNNMIGAERKQPRADFERVEGKKLFFDLGQRSVIYKVHGTVPLSAMGDGGYGYLIAEEDYTRFLGRMEHDDFVPVGIRRIIIKKKKIGNFSVPANSLLFLGYSMQDWNLRVLLEELRIGRSQSNFERHYAIMKEPGKEDKELLSRRNINLYDCDLTDFSNEMDRQLCQG